MTNSTDNLKLTPSNTRTALLFAAMVVWFVAGVSRYASAGGLLTLALSIVGFTGAVVYGLMLLPGSSYLEATETGLTVCSAYRKRQYDWQEIESFYVDTILTRQVVKYRLASTSDEANGVASYDREEALPDTYGLTAEELADQLEGFRRQAHMAPPV